MAGSNLKRPQIIFDKDWVQSATWTAVIQTPKSYIFDDPDDKNALESAPSQLVAD